MKVNKEGIYLIAGFEGLSLKPYMCPAKKPTIGYGNTYYRDGRKVTMLDEPITNEEAVKLLEVVVDSFAKQVSKLVTAPLNQNQFNSVVSFAFNVGVGSLKNSTLLKLINKDHNQIAIANEFLKWVNIAGKKSKGLENRRIRESQIYFKK
jgi:lysozyme